MNRRTFVIGGHTTSFIGKKHPDFIWKGHPDFGSRENPSIEDYIRMSISGALAATGVDAANIERAWIGNFVGELFSKQGHLGAAMVGAADGLAYKPMTRVEAACASGGLAFASAVESISAGTDIALAVGVEVQTTESARVGGDYLARASHYVRQRAIDDFTFPALFAKRTAAYRQATGTNEEDIGRVAVKAYSNANRNPRAHMRSVKLDLATASTASDRNPTFLSNQELAPFMKMSDCSQVSDGGSAIIIASEAGLRKLGKTEADAIEVVALSHATGNLWHDGDLTRLETTAHAANAAYAAAGVRPDQINVAEVHDCFTVTELLMMEALGFAAFGQSASLVREGRTEITGDRPINTGGGLVGFGHPVGATGIKQVLEIYNQMKGLCGDYQIPTLPRIGLTANMGGDDKTVVVSIFR